MLPNSLFGSLLKQNSVLFRLDDKVIKIAFFNRMNRKGLIIMSLIASLTACTFAEPVLKCSFAKGQWDPNDWTLVKSHGSEHVGDWVQKETHIENRTPSGATPKEQPLPTSASTRYCPGFSNQTTPHPPFSSVVTTSRSPSPSRSPR